MTNQALPASWSVATLALLTLAACTEASASTDASPLAGAHDAAAPIDSATAVLDAPAAPDAAIDQGSVADAGAVAACDPFARTGCNPGEKCSQLIVQTSPFVARTACVPDGSVAEGFPCTVGPAGASTGFDDCAAGEVCFHGFCEAICRQAPDSCPVDIAPSNACTPIDGLFDDLGGPPALGVCECSPLDDFCAGSPA